MAGNFLSRPKRDGPGECDTNEKMAMSYGVIGVQGWRMSMEDAHICICDFKEHCERTLNCDAELLAQIPEQSSLFAVFDGHGGEEVAILCSRKFPQFLVEDENFKKSDFEAALKSTYMRIDQYIKSSEGQEVLQQILDEKAQNKNDDYGEEDDTEEDMDEVDHDSDEEIRTGDCDDDDNEEDQDGEEGDEGDGEEDGDALSEGTGQLLNSLISGGFLTFLADRTKQMKEELSALGDEDDDDDDEDDFNPDDVTSSDGEEDDEEEGEEEEDEAEEENEDDKEDDEKDDCEGGVEETENNDESKNTNDEINTESKAEASESKAPENGVSKVEIDENGAGDATKNSEGEDDSQGDSAEESLAKFMKRKGDSAEESFAKSLKRKKSSPKKLVSQPNEEGGESKENGTEDDSETDEDDTEMSNGDGDMESDALMEKPGFDSGCTAVVAFKVASKLYVANAGDSRCVLSLNSVAMPLSHDHNPSVPEEVARVEAAGGQIEGGRVDGGLNLTRAFGDHRYKQNADLPAEKQRISAEAEVTVTDLSTSEKKSNSDFLVLACDGIWECLASEIVVSEIADRLNSHDLFNICHQMTEKCIAPSSRGNQTTGLDNMTIIIVTLEPHKLTTKFVNAPKSKKKQLEGDKTENSENTIGDSDIKSDIDAKNGGDINANGISGAELCDEKAGNGVFENGIEKSDLKRPNESTLKNEPDESSQNCKALKME